MNPAAIPFGSMISTNYLPSIFSLFRSCTRQCSFTRPAPSDFGLNGTFRTKKQIGGLNCELFFDWSNGGNLKEVSLHTQPLDTAAFPARLQKNWSELSELLSMLHGNPLQAAKFPEASELQNDLFLGTHLWPLEGGGTAMLGIAKEADQYLIVVRFTTETLKPVLIP